MKRVLLTALALAQAAPGAAQDSPPWWAGVWEGRVGTLPVRACLDGWGDQPGRGSYYYLSRLEPIRLADAGDGMWLEGDHDANPQVEWFFEQFAEGVARGLWRQGKRELRFELRPVAWEVGEDAAQIGPCGSAAFLAPRLAGGTVRAEAAELGGWRYTARTYHAPAHLAEDVDLSSFLFAPNRPGDERILAELAKDLPTGSHLDAYAQCMGDSIATNGVDGYYTAASRPVLVSRNWITTVDSYDLYCGGAHPSHGYAHRTFDRTSGDRVNLARWLNERALEHRTYEGDADGYDLVRPALRDLIVARGTSEVVEADEGPEAAEFAAECRELAVEEQFWTFGLSRNGMLFVPSVPHVAAACVTTYTLEWDDLEPFLSEAGRAGLARLRER